MEVCSGDTSKGVACPRRQGSRTRVVITEAELSAPPSTRQASWLPCCEDRKSVVVTNNAANIIVKTCCSSKSTRILGANQFNCLRSWVGFHFWLRRCTLFEQRDVARAAAGRSLSF
ncbi:hypothetical protein GOP47_0022449 [Adiantum capillus-veneris]|uniref:Uncharacterized protein n=1 Tax=Adiantum capillus-veneris TaxID=13818 RepID=A0A9D4U5V1_ADICA|nr:hypothetical protein GOP47_0022449 [Adiantum capillus-veneris]